MEPTFVPSELITVASKKLEEEIDKELEEEDPKEENSLAKLLNEDSK